MSETKVKGVVWDLVRYAVVFCNDHDVRKRLTTELRSANIDVRRGHDIQNLRGVRNTLVVIHFPLGQLWWKTAADHDRHIAELIKKGNQVIYV